MEEQNYQMCNYCVMDTTDSEIKFDENGVCNNCKRALTLIKSSVYSQTEDEKSKSLKDLIRMVKTSGARKKYDCIIGLSGGVDSSFVAYSLKKHGLNPLAIHLDNGWNSELSVKNIEKICKILDIDLFTYVLNWEEFKDLQLSFLKASTPDSEIPSDHAIIAILYKMAIKHNIKYIIAGSNLTSETIMPRTWSYGHNDWKYIKSVQKIHGTCKLKDFPHFSMFKFMYYKIFRRITWVAILDYLNYDKAEAKQLLINELEWKDYGGKHEESIYTKFYQDYILTKKFGIDKRKAHFSSLICSNYMTREQAIEELQRPTYDEKKLNDEIEYVAKKLNVSINEFHQIMAIQKKTFHDYPNNTDSFYSRLAYKIYRKFSFKI
jgi:N-acetyl sugar amidotransferase